MITVEYDMQGKTRSEWQEELGYLWKVDDKAWLEQRKREWKFLVKNQYSDNSASSNKKYMQFYVYGKGNDYIDPISRYLFIPFQSADEAKVVFEVLFGPDEHERLLNNFINLAAYSEGLPIIDSLPWIRNHVQYFVEGVLGDEYQEIEEKPVNGGRARKISPEPSWWCRTYIFRAISVLDGKVSYSGCIDCVPYFVSCLPHFNIAKERKRAKFKPIVEGMNKILGQDAPNPFALEFAQELKSCEDEILQNWAMNAHLDVDD